MRASKSKFLKQPGMLNVYLLYLYAKRIHDSSKFNEMWNKWNEMMGGGGYTEMWCRASNPPPPLYRRDSMKTKLVVCLNTTTCFISHSRLPHDNVGTLSYWNCVKRWQINLHREFFLVALTPLQKIIRSCLSAVFLVFGSCRSKQMWIFLPSATNDCLLGKWTLLTIWGKSSTFAKTKVHENTLQCHKPQNQIST
jgi:hypothetical protein